jgi:hypothetical protein
MKRHITIDIVTSSTIEDVLTALSLLSDDAIINIQSKPHVAPLIEQRDDGGFAPANPGVTVSQSAPLPGLVAQPTQVELYLGTASAAKPWTRDPRLVWDNQNRRIDTDPTLENMGLTKDQLFAMRAKIGTLEHATKMSISKKGYYDKVGRTPSTRPALGKPWTKRD